MQPTKAQCTYNVSENTYDLFTPSIIACLLIAGFFVKYLARQEKFSDAAVLMLMGVLIRFSLELNVKFATIKNVISKQVLHSSNEIIQITFPLMLFITGYTLDNQIFTDVIYQCLILSILGYPISIILTSICMLYIFPSYEWEWQLTLIFGVLAQISDLFGSIDMFKANNRDTKHVSTLIQGESLIINALAMMIMEVFLPLLKLHCSLLRSILTFCSKAIFSSLIGFLAGTAVKLSSHYPYQNKIAVITFLFASCYFIFSLSTLLHASGGLAVVVMVIMVNNEKYSFPPEVERVVQKFWEMGKLIFEILLSILIGVITAESLLHIYDLGSPSVEDYLRFFITFVATLVIKIFTVVILFPILCRSGYGFDWKKGLIISIGSMKGCVTLLLGKISRTFFINDQSANVLFLHLRVLTTFTILINTACLRYLIRVTGINSVSSARKTVMANAIRYLNKTMENSFHAQQLDPFLSNANWKWVKIHTHIEDPYKEYELEPGDIPFYQSRYIKCTNCFAEHVLPATDYQLAQMRKESSIRALKAAQTIYWYQFHNGIISKDAAKRLSITIEWAIQTKQDYLDVSEVKKHMVINKYTRKTYDIVIKMLDIVNAFVNKERRELEKKNKEEFNQSRIIYSHHFIENLIYSPQLEFMIHILLFVSLLINILELISVFHLDKNSAHRVLVLSSLFFCFLSIESIIFFFDILFRMFLFGFKDYFGNPINVVSFVAEFVDFLIILLYYTGRSIVFKFSTAYTFYKILLHLHLLIFLRLVFLIKPALIMIKNYLNTKIKKNLYQCFEIAYCFIVGEEEIRNKTDMIINYEELSIWLKEKVEKNRLFMIREMTQMQRTYPEVVIGATSRLAARIIFRKTIDHLINLEKNGLIEKNIFYKLKRNYENKMKNFTRLPTGISVKRKIEDILKNTEWIMGQKQYKYFISISTRKTYEQGDIIHSRENFCTGIHIILSGVVKVEGIAQYQRTNLLPNTDSMKYFDSGGYFEDYLFTGQTLGLIGILNQKEFVTDSVCETEVTTIFINEAQMKEAMNQFHNLEYHLWRVVAIGIAMYILKYHRRYQSFSDGMLKDILRKALLPNLFNRRSFRITKEIRDIVLIQGKIIDEDTKNEYLGPIYIAEHATNLLFPSNISYKVRPIVLILASEDYKLPDMYQWSIRHNSFYDILCPIHKSRYKKSGKKFSSKSNQKKLLND
ncbi:sodium/hydrogen exchanger 10-like isoform X1 [Centruroides sculpturatus]|uniref:sodium/hydrogen exchanger 10-like isoform X1 n=2 Tax=Centruroides sculpturatus TaxID=218467 RepID=UPI000C6CAFF1|nr:sodium/hydrogen exchanger 10-like isoform X1 [Centruroides sculpturatus]